MEEGYPKVAILHNPGERGVGWEFIHQEKKLINDVLRPPPLVTHLIMQIKLLYKIIFYVFNYLIYNNVFNIESNQFCVNTMNSPL